MFSPSQGDASSRIYRLKRTVLEVHQAVRRSRPRGRFGERPPSVVPEPMRPYFRDVHDHLLREIGRVIELRELLTSILTASMT